MLPPDLNAAQFSSYPPEARALATTYLMLLRQLPLAFLASLLRELADFDYRLPAERSSMTRQLRYLASLTPGQLAQTFQAFRAIRISPEQSAKPWCTHPLDFTEQFSAYLWSTQQMDAFRAAAAKYGVALSEALPPAPLPAARLGIAVIGKGATLTSRFKPFVKLREHGTLFTAVDPQDGLLHLLATVQTRAQAYPAPFSHWYVDGDIPVAHHAGVTNISYAELAPARAALFKVMQKQLSAAGMGPEQLRDGMSRLTPADLGLQDSAVLDHFKVKLLTEGSGTQIFATTFAQWTAREVLRRAEALTLLTRFAPRQRQRPMNDLLTGDPDKPDLDVQGSLVDADMAAYYQYLNQQRLPGFEHSLFLAWIEEHNQAFAIGPAVPRGSVSRSPITLPALLTFMGV